LRASRATPDEGVQRCMHYSERKTFLFADICFSIFRQTAT
jgi:hypothetical protein